MKKLLIITQKVDENDQLLSFFLDWIRGFSQRFSSVGVLCLEKGQFNLPGIRVITLGKDKGLPKPFWLLNLYRQSFKLRKDYDIVLVHMNPIWVVAGSWFWHVLNKKVALWYTHKSVTIKLRLAEKFSDVIFTASKESFRMPSKKVTTVGHGINLNKFKPSNKERYSNSLLSVGRIAPVKNYDVLIDAIKIVRKEGVNPKVTIIGEPALISDKEYYSALLERIKNLGLGSNFEFLGKISHDDLPKFYQSHNLFVHMSKTGSLDKTVLEAMACGMNVISSNDASRSFLPDSLVFDDNPENLARVIINNINKSHAEDLIKYIVKNHDLNLLLDKIERLV